jgi:hypothetical protein
MTSTLLHRLFERETWSRMGHGGVKPGRGPSLTEASEKGQRRAKLYADNTSSHPSVDEFGQLADVAAQPELGLLSERRSGLGRGGPSRTVASRQSLKLLNHA